MPGSLCFGNDDDTALHVIHGLTLSYLPELRTRTQTALGRSLIFDTNETNMSKWKQIGAGGG